jgi:predicted AAA+ superfamily ATPase
MQRPFGFRDVSRFNALVEFVPGQSGGRLERTRFARGWDPLRHGDYGPLWEYLVFEHLQASFPGEPIRYWRNKAGREVDFVLVRTRDRIDTVECKWDPSQFDPASLEAFRSRYPRGRNYLVTPREGPAYVRRFGALEVLVCDPAGIGRDIVAR